MDRYNRLPTTFVVSLVCATPNSRKLPLLSVSPTIGPPMVSSLELIAREVGGPAGTESDTVATSLKPAWPFCAHLKRRLHCLRKPALNGEHKRANEKTYDRPLSVESDRTIVTGLPIGGAIAKLSRSPFSDTRR